MDNFLAIAASLQTVNERIAAACARAGREVSEVEIVGVTKTHGPDLVQAAREAGIQMMGENRVQEAAAKIPQCGSGPEWHLIGHLQRNKVRQALELFSVIHSVDSLRLLEHIESVAGEFGYAPELLIEVNVSGESSKQGLSPEAMPAMMERVLECRHITVTGLMTMAPFVPEAEATRPVFKKLHTLRDELEHRFAVGLPRLSMGMSNDFEVAVEEGATWVRLGSILFGKRGTWRSQRTAGDIDV